MYIYVAHYVQIITPRYSFHALIFTRGLQEIRKYCAVYGPSLQKRKSAVNIIDKQWSMNQIFITSQVLV
jgi:hypothetical protein